MTDVFVGIGSNVAPERSLGAALAALTDTFGDLDRSPVYRSAPVGFDGADFLNMVVAFACEWNVHALPARLKAIEAQVGRSPQGERRLDLDLLLYGDCVLDSPTLRLPRPDLLKYAFVARPMADLVPQRRHPVCKQSYRAIWAGFDAARQPLTRVELA